jgi:predicted anti-sigma-YlaC factor YlaD
VSCLEVREQLAVALLTGTTWDDELDDHLAGCEECRHELAQLREVVDLMVYAPPQDLATPIESDLRLRRLIAAAERERGRRHRWSLVAIAAAVLVLLVLPGAVVLNHLVSSGPAPVVTATVESSATNHVTGVSAHVSLSPSASGSGVSVAVGGVPAQTRCSLVVVGKDGSRQVLLTWDASYSGTAEFRTSTDVPTAGIAGLDLVDASNGHLLVAVPLSD